MIPRGIRREKVPEALRLIRAGEEIAGRSMDESLSRVPEIDERRIEDLRKELRNLMQQFPDPLRQKSDEAQEFDSKACVLIHSTLNLPPELSASGDLWRWLAIAKFSDLIEWRHGEGGEAREANFGGGSFWDNLLTRLWIRADVVFDPVRSNPYELARLGGGDFWRSHLIRIRYGSCRTLARTFVIRSYPHPAEPRKSSMTGKQVRELAKRLRRLQATVAFELLDESSADALIKGELENVRLAT